MAHGPCPRCHSLSDRETVGPIGTGPCPLCGYHAATFQEPGRPTEADRLLENEHTVDLCRDGEPEPAGSAVSSLVFGPYRILGLIGKGGMGIVYRVRHEPTGREAALKTVRARRREILHWFRREMHAMSRIRHRGVVAVLETGQAKGQPWYAMELLQGATLHNYLQTAWDHSSPEAGLGSGSVPSSRTPTEPLLDPHHLDGRAASWCGPPSRPMPLTAGALQDFLTLIARLCSVLAYLHGEGIVHRDLKPRNIVVRPDGTPVLFDFGLASHFGAARAGELASRRQARRHAGIHGPRADPGRVRGCAGRPLRDRLHPLPGGDGPCALPVADHARPPGSVCPRRPGPSPLSGEGRPPSAGGVDPSPAGQAAPRPDRARPRRHRRVGPPGR